MVIDSRNSRGKNNNTIARKKLASHLGMGHRFCCRPHFAWTHQTMPPLKVSRWLPLHVLRRLSFNDTCAGAPSRATTGYLCSPTICISVGLLQRKNKQTKLNKTVESGRQQHASITIVSPRTLPTGEPRARVSTYLWNELGSSCFVETDRCCQVSMRF